MEIIRLLNSKNIIDALVVLLIVFIPNSFMFSDGILREQAAEMIVLIFISIILLSVIIFNSTQNTKQIHLSAIDFLAGCYLFYGIINIIFARGKPIGIDEIAKWMIMLLLYAFFRSFKNRTPVIIGILVSGVIQAVITYLQYFDLVNSNNHYFALTGSFGNPGQLGGFLALSAVASVNAFYHFKPKYLTFFVILLILPALILTDSRAAWLATVIGIAYLHKDKCKRIVNSFVARATLMIVLTSFGILLYIYKPVSANGRLFIWRVCFDMIKEKPVFGYGVGSFGYHYMYYQADFFEKNPDSKFVEVADNVAYPYNEFIRVWIEQGIIGLIIFILLLIAIFKYSIFQKHQGVISILIVWLVFSCFSYPASVYSLMFMFSVILGSIRARSLKRIKVPICSSVFVLFLASTIVFSIFSLQDIRLFNKMKDLKRMEAFFPKFSTNKMFLNAYTQQIMKSGDNSKVIELLIHASKIIPSSELFCDLGTVYKQTGDYMLSEKCFKQAENMVPSRIYPLYGLFLLYDKTGNNHLAKKYALKIISHKVKVHNTLSLQIIGTAKKYLNKNT